MTGRPTSFTQEMADTICERIAEGESLRSICADDDMPNKATVFRWLAADPAFSDQYARARETQADTLFDDVLEIADTEPDHNRARVKIDARKWMAGKMKPKVYGDKQDLTVTINPLEAATDDELVARVAALDEIIRPLLVAQREGDDSRGAGPEDQD